MPVTRFGAGGHLRPRWIVQEAPVDMTYCLVLVIAGGGLGWGCVVSLVLTEVVKWKCRDGGGISLCFRGGRKRAGGGKRVLRHSGGQ